jgi:hypothetical protein
MAQIDPILYNTIAQSYASISDSLDTVEVDARTSVDSIVDVTTFDYPTVVPSAADAEAALEIELAVLSPFNSAYVQAQSISTNISEILDAVRTINDFVIAQSSFDGTGKEKLDNWINVEMFNYWSYGDEGQFFLYGTPSGWANLSESAGYNIDDWNTDDIENVDLTSNTVAQYKMNDTVNPTVENTFGTDGTYVGTLTSESPGKINDALVFNGTSQYVNTTQSFQSTFRNSFSINCWVRPDDGQPAPPDYIYGATLASSFYRFYLQLSGASITAIYDPGAGVLTTSTTSGFSSGVNTTWKMITVTFEDNGIGVNSILSLYIDGVFKISDSAILNPDFFSSTGFFIGALSNGTVITAGSYFDGAVDNLCIFDKVISQDEIDFLYNQGVGTEELKNF